MALEAGGIGARLRAGREKLGLTVLQVAERMHTDPKIVEAIEVDNYAALGAPVYARGHIRHYAELVGESATELINLYSDLGKVGQPDLTQIVKAPSASESNKLVAPTLVVIAVFAVAGAIWWVSALSKKKPQLSETHVVGEEQSAATANTESAAAGSGQPSSETPAQTGPSDRSGTGAASTAGRPGVGNAGSAPTRSPSGAGSATPAATGRGISSATPPPANRPTTSPTLPPGRPGAPGTPPPSTRVASAALPSGGSASASGSGSTAATSPPPPARSKNQAQVTLRYSADSWTEVYDATGARLFYDVGSANSVQTVVGTPPLRVVLGNASGVAVEFNGHRTPIAKLAHPDGSVQFSINRSGRVIRAKPVADGG